MYSVFIIEDELLIAEMLKEMLLDLQYDVAHIANDYDSAIDYLANNKKPDICLVDINLESSKNGFDLVKVLNETYQIPFIFLTSYSDKKTILEASQYNPEAYIIKPFKPSDLFTTIEIAKQKTSSKSNTEKSIVIKDGSNSYKINLNDIIYLKSDNVYVELFLTNKKHIIRQSLDSFIEELNYSNMIRIHRSYAVNLLFITAMNGKEVLVGSESLPVSRKNKEEVIARFKAK